MKRKCVWSNIAPKKRAKYLVPQFIFRKKAMTSLSRSTLKIYLDMTKRTIFVQRAKEKNKIVQIGDVRN